MLCNCAVRLQRVESVGKAQSAKHSRNSTLLRISLLVAPSGSPAVRAYHRHKRLSERSCALQAAQQTLQPMTAHVNAQSKVPIQEMVDLAVVWACQHGLVSSCSLILSAFECGCYIFIVALTATSLQKPWKISHSGSSSKKAVCQQACNVHDAGRGCWRL